MLRQFFTTDAVTIRAAIQAYQDKVGPIVVARLKPGLDVVEIVGAQTRGNELQVQTTDLQWHVPFACYKNVEE